VVQRKQVRVAQEGIRVGDVAINVDPRLESEADRMGKQALSPALAHRHQPLQHNVHTDSQSNLPVQLQVTINGGAQRVNETYYQTGGGKSIGSKHAVAALIGDNVPRVFLNSADLEEFANAKTDYTSATWLSKWPARSGTGCRRQSSRYSKHRIGIHQVMRGL
jgi:hypothetical protein